MTNILYSENFLWWVTKYFYESLSDFLNICQRKIIEKHAQTIFYYCVLYDNQRF